MAAALTMRVTVTPDFIAAEVLRAALKHIRDEHEANPFAYSAEEAADLAREALAAADELERQGEHYGA